MSTQSVISLPVDLEIGSALSGNRLQNKEIDKGDNKNHSKQVNFNPLTRVVSFTDSLSSINVSGLRENLSTDGKRRLIKVSERSFVLRKNDPVNLKIVLSPSRSIPNMVNKLFILKTLIVISLNETLFRVMGNFAVVLC